MQRQSTQLAARLISIGQGLANIGSFHSCMLSCASTNLVLAHFDGAFNLRSLAGPSKYIKKPRMFATDMPAMHMSFDKCFRDKSHGHLPCEGKDTRPTGGYTRPLARVVHKSFRTHCDGYKNEGGEAQRPHLNALWLCQELS